MQYTERQTQIIRFFRAKYETYGKNAETYPIFVWRDEDSALGFVYPQEIDEMIESGCTLFVAIAPKTVNMYATTDYRIHRNIMTQEGE